MLKKFKSKLFSARGAFEGGPDDDEEKAPPTAAEDEVGVAESHDQRGINSEDAMKWYADHRQALILILQLPLGNFLIILLLLKSFQMPLGNCLINAIINTGNFLSSLRMILL